MTRTPALLALLVALTASGAARASPAPEGPKEFLERIYAAYRKPTPSAVDYLTPPNDRRAFEPGLVALIRRDEAKNAADPIDWLSEADMFCECQDFEDIHSRVVLTRLDPERAEASVSVSDLGQKPVRLRFTLVRTAAGWRIWDLVGSNGRSLRRALEADLSGAPAPRQHRG